MKKDTAVKVVLGALALGMFVLFGPRVLEGRLRSEPAVQIAAAATAPNDPFVKRKQKWEKQLTTVKDPNFRFSILAEVAMFALDNQQWDKAEKYARELLELAPQFPKNWNYGNALHKGHLVLGRIALQRNDLATAKAELLASGKTPGSPQMDTFGPNMSLAKALLEKGEKETVLAYFAQCSHFWQPRFSKLPAWRDDVMAGRIPDFGANLVY